MSMNKKGQSALEFLMTYGWAILVVLAAIGALAYFGVLNPSNFLPDQCTASTGFGCVGKPVISASQTVFVVTNGVGAAVQFDQTRLTVVSSAGATCTRSNVWFCDKGSDSNTCTGNTGAANKTVSDGQDFMVVMNCTTTGNIHKSTLTLNYTNSLSSLPDQMLIQISGKKK